MKTININSETKVSVKDKAKGFLSTFVRSSTGGAHVSLLAGVKIVEHIEGKIIQKLDGQSYEDVIQSRRKETLATHDKVIKTYEQLRGKVNNLSEVKFGSKEEVIVEGIQYGNS